MSPKSFLGVRQTVTGRINLVGAFLKALVASAHRWAGTRSEEMRLTLTRAKANAFLRVYRAQYTTADIWRRYGSRVVIGAVAGSWILMMPHQRGLEKYFAEAQRLSNLRAVLYTLGGALLGAAAIVSSLVLFSMQVNVERMPHGLFRRLSADGQLLGAFAGSFLLAIGVIASAIAADKAHVTVVLFGAGWSTLLILTSFFFPV